MPKIYQGWYFIYPIEKELVIIKKPDKQAINTLNDQIEQFIVNNIVHPGLPKVTELLYKYPTLPAEILTAISSDNNDLDYQTIEITKGEDNEIPIEVELPKNFDDDSIDSIEFDLIN